MGLLRPVGSVQATSGTPTPVYTGPSANLLTAASFSISKGIATIVVANTYDSNPWTPYAVGNIVGLYGFSTATYFNGVPVTVLDATTAKFRFYFNHADVASTADTGKCFIMPPTYRTVRLSLPPTAGAGVIYVGDGSVSSTKFIESLSLATKPWFEFDGDAIPAGRIHIDTDTSTTPVMVSVTY